MRKRLKNNVLSMILVGAGTLMLASCIDDAYDLSDIDTTTRVSLDSLTIPVNLDEIYLKNIVDTTTNDISLIDGMYAFEKTGKFQSGDIRINAVHLNAPDIPTSRLTIDASSAESQISSTGSATLTIGSTNSSFSYSTTQVSDEILSIDDIGTEMTISFVIGFDNLDDKVSSMTFKNVLLQLPKGMTVDASRTTGEYNDETGELKVPETRVNGTGLTINIVATKVDSRAGYVLRDHKISYSDDLRVKQGEVVINKNDLRVPASQLPKSLQYGVRYLLSSLDIKTFSGDVQYSISGFSHPEINTGALPKLLSQDQTDIKLKNPQIYISINNPASPWGVYGSTGMSLTPWRHQSPGEPIGIPAGSMVIPAMSSPTAQAVFCLSPEKPNTYLEGYENANYIAYPGLGNIFSGEGIPSMLRVEMVEPRMPAQHVTDFPVGVNLGKLIGNYNFYCPLELVNGSKIIYTATEDGWSSEDLEKLVITYIHIRALVTSDAPLSLHFSGYPIDRDGNRISGCEIKDTDVPAFAKDYPIDIYLSGEVRNLDGFEFTATGISQDEEALNDQMSIKLDNLKVCVSAYYTTEL